MFPVELWCKIVKYLGLQNATRWPVLFPFLQLHPPYRHYLKVACLEHRLLFAQWLVDSQLVTRNDARELLCDIAARCQLPVLQWTIQTFHLTRDEFLQETIFNYFVRKLDAAQWLTTTLQIPADVIREDNCFLFRWAAMDGHLDTLQWLTSTFQLTKADVAVGSWIAFMWAAMQGHLHVLKWMTATFGVTTADLHQVASSIFWEAANNDNLSVMKWMADHFDFTWEELGRKKALSIARRWGYLNVVHWLQQQ
jgi:hypothetical protein